MKRIVTIQDISCFGKCSLTASLPVISAMGIETAVLPTAVLSAHTMFPHPAILSLEDMMEPIAEHWKSQGFCFDAIYTGYLASERQVEIVRRFLKDFGKEGTLRFIDPAMADHGKLYSGFHPGFPEVMAGLCGEADMIVPNLTEACLLTGTQYCPNPSPARIRSLLDKLADLGTGKAVIITGAVSDRNLTGASALDLTKGEYFEITSEKLPVSMYGTGDIFASVTVGALTAGKTLQEALKLAADFVFAAIRQTLDHDPEKRYGVDFEPVLSMLTGI